MLWVVANDITSNSINNTITAPMITLTAASGSIGVEQDGTVNPITVNLSRGSESLTISEQNLIVTANTSDSRFNCAGACYRRAVAL